MNKVVVKCPAKINLSLDVVGKREDGYHLLKMLMQSIGIYDFVTVKKIDDDITVYCENRDVPCDKNNICYKAAKVMLEKYNLHGGLSIVIDKKIPVAAGLAGGSADAAGVIIGINKLYDLNLELKEMMEVGVKIGADVPFCLHGGTALAEGIGEILTPVNKINAWVVLAKPPISLSTAEVFGKLKIDEIVKHPNTNKLLKYIEKNDIKNLAQNMINVLETVSIKENPIIFEIKNIMMEFHALGSLMSGSGPSVFGLFEDKLAAEGCYHRLRDYLKEVYMIKTV